MKKVLVYSPNPLDGVSFYRQWGPLSQLHEKIQAFSFPNDPAQITHWTYFLNYDICLFSRPHRLQDLAFAEECKKWGLPIWLDYDDALLEIPKDNPVSDTFSSDHSKAIILKVIELADVITTSSHLIKKQFEGMGKKNVIRVPNALDDRFLRYAKNPKKSGVNQITAWRGSESHLRDLLYYGSAIQKALKSQNQKALFWGIYPTFLEGSGVGFQFEKTRNQIDFIRAFTQCFPAELIVPLVDHYFNRVKSNLAWLDGTLAGAVCLVPDWPEWQEPGQFRYRAGDREDFAYKLEKLISMPRDQKRELWQESFDFIEKNLLLSKVNSVREEIIHEYCRK